LESALVKNAFCTVHHDLNDTDLWHSRHHFIPRYTEAAAVVCLNETQKQILSTEEGLPIGKLFVVPHGYNDELLSLKAPRSGHGEKFTLGIASRRYGRRVKGEAYLHELIKRLDPSLIKFILVGQDRSLDAIGMRQLGFEVEVFERLPYRVFQGFYGAIDCLLMCSGHEGGPASVPESLATGTPVLTSRVGMSIDFIISGDDGHFLELNPDEDANVIHRLASTPQAYASLEATCRSLAADAPSREAARTSSTLREGAALLRGSRRHGLQTLACACLAGDEALESEARAQVSTDTQRRAFELSVALAPWSRYAELRDLLP
jgi:glycosyltransferase involved in cell wall biosynthesis